MIINEGVFSSTFATNLIIQNQITVGWPKHIAAYLGKGYLGLSFSCDGDKAYLAACGEYAERAYFHKKLKGEFKKRLSDLPQRNKFQLKIFLKQMCPNQWVDEIDNHKFDMCTATSIFEDGKKIFVPTALLSIGKQADSHFVCSRDTTGNSVHFDKKKCYENSLLEFVERQSLITSYIYSKGQSRFEIDQLSIFGRNEKVVEKLMQYGSIHAADISMFKGVYTVLLCFSSYNREASVKYSVGCSSGFSISEAFEKSASELYSSFVTMLSVYEMDDNSYYEEYQKNMDYYLKLFYKKNNSKTYEEFRVFSDEKIPIVKTSEAILYPSKSQKDLLDGIALFSKEVYCYKSVISFPNKAKLHVCKTFSLEMFYNMDVSRKCNLDNVITRQYGKIEPGSLGFIPFP